MKYTFEEIKKKPHYLKIGTREELLEDFPKEDASDSREKYRRIIEPWLSASLQSEHLAILIGSGLTSAVCKGANVESSSMEKANFGEFEDKINLYAENIARKMNRGKHNIEDQIRTAITLLDGYEIDGNASSSESLKKIVDNVLREFRNSILQSETGLMETLESDDIEVEQKAKYMLSMLQSFLLTFASRNATRERTHIFTTNYDRFIEYGCDLAGIKIIDRFWGKIAPQFQESPLNIDYYYHMPDVKNEFRFAEGVVRYSKIHGSIDWYEKNGTIFKDALRFGAKNAELPTGSNYKDHLMIYPNSMKSIETAFYPYSELFRDFSMEICRPNTTLVVYGYGFGDSHINKVIKEMLNLPSTHIVIFAHSIKDSEINFMSSVNMAQVSVIGGHEFGDLSNLVNYYLPKAAIDRITKTAGELVESRRSYEEAVNAQPKNNDKEGAENESNE